MQKARGPVNAVFLEKALWFWGSSCRPGEADSFVSWSLNKSTLESKRHPAFVVPEYIFENTVFLSEAEAAPAPPPSPPSPLRTGPRHPWQNLGKNL